MRTSASTINTDYRKDWGGIEYALVQDRCDLLLVSTEQLNNVHFLKGVLPLISKQISLFVVDEAHCISDCGNDFRNNQNPEETQNTRIQPAGTHHDLRPPLMEKPRK